MIYAKAEGQKLYLSGENVVADSVKYLKIYFETDDEWIGYDITAVFTDYKKNSYNVVLVDGNPLYLGNGCCYVPHEVINSPNFTVSIFGTRGDSVITTSAVTVCVKESGYIEGQTPNPPTPDEYQQIMSAVDDIRDVAQSVRNDADNGIFKGEQGERGPSGVYVGSGSMPEDCNVQIDPNGVAVDANSLATKEYVDERLSNLDPDDMDVDLSDYPTREEMQQAINPLCVDYIVEQGTSDIWTWEKWNSGTVKMWCKTSTTNTNEYIARATISYPTGITLVEEGCAFVTIRSGFQNLGFGLDINAKAIAMDTKATIYVHKLSGGLTEDNSNIPVSLFVTGKWK